MEPIENTDGEGDMKNEGVCNLTGQKTGPVSGNGEEEVRRGRKYTMPPFDRFDKLSIGIMVLLIGWLTVLITVLDTAPIAGNHSYQVEASIPPVASEYATKLKIGQQLLAAADLPKLKPIIDEMIGAYPYQAEPFMLLGDYYLRTQQPLAAMHAYRQAIDLDVDYLDKKTPIYQGKKIKNTVNDAEKIIFAKLKENPADDALVESRKEFYYMQRKLLGNCGDY